jgi:SAM-dependent methyltransferase
MEFFKKWLKLMNKIKSILLFFIRMVTIPFVILSIFYKPKLKKVKELNHQHWVKFLKKKFNKKNIKILEIGSRVVTGQNLRKCFNRATYVGFDYYSGENVDIVGDAHFLSKYFENNEFDLVISSSVFEHLYAPWILPAQINKILKPQGYVFIETHFSFKSHERPWNFFQFSDKALEVLFSNVSGFSSLKSGMHNPILGFFTAQSNLYLIGRPVNELYCHSSIYAKKIKNVNNPIWQNININFLKNKEIYPKNKKIRD